MFVKIQESLRVAHYYWVILIFAHLKQMTKTMAFLEQQRSDPVRNPEITICCKEHVGDSSIYGTVCVRCLAELGGYIQLMGSTTSLYDQKNQEHGDLICYMKEVTVVLIMS